MFPTYDTLSAPAVPPPAADKRDAARLACPWPTTVRLLATPAFHRLSVQIRDLSVNGVGLLTPRPLDLDARLALDWAFGPTDRWRTLQARVIHVTPHDGGGYVVGCEFDHPLDDAEVSHVLWHFSRVLSFHA